MLFVINRAFNPGADGKNNGYNRQGKAEPNYKIRRFVAYEKDTHTYAEQHDKNRPKEQFDAFVFHMDTSCLIECIS